MLGEPLRQPPGGDQRESDQEQVGSPVVPHCGQHQKQRG
jgi:hypothetical protein